MTFKLKFCLFFSLLISIFMPLLGGLYKWQGLPPGFDILATEQMKRPPFDLTVFLILGVIGVVIWLFLLFPKRFGFKTSDNKNNVIRSSHKPFPVWFWIGGVVTLISWTIMWGQFAFLGDLRFFSFVPLWWGYILFVDGLVYKLQGGKSFIAIYRKELMLCALLSIFGWYYFEYLNFFVLQNWYYPYLDLIPSPETYVWSAITFSTVWPAVFICYQLVNSFNTFTLPYENGPKINFSRFTLKVILLLGGIICVITSVWPNYLFWLIWLGPLMIMSATLGLLNIWTPFSPISKGDWRPIMTIGIATLINALCWEMWNYWSAPNNPNFWKYNLPFVHEFLIFEMPILGYTGYIFFGPTCWVFWIALAKLFNISSKINLSGSAKSYEHE